MIWNVWDEAAPVRAVQRHTAPKLAWSPDGSKLASGGEHAKVVVWAAPSCDPLVALRPSPDINEDVWCLCWSPDGAMIAALCGGEHCRVRLWDLATERCLQVLDLPHRAYIIRWSGNTLKSIMASETLLWNADARAIREAARWEAALPYVWMMAETPDVPGARAILAWCAGRHAATKLAIAQFLLLL